MTLKSYTVFQILSFSLGVIIFIPQAPELNSLLKWNFNITVSEKVSHQCTQYISGQEISNEEIWIELQD